MGEPCQQRMWNHARLRQAPEGSVLAREGVQDNVLVLVEQAACGFAPPAPAGLADPGSGTLFGEMALLEGRLPVATVVAGPGCEVREVEEDRLAATMAADPLLARDV